MPMLPANIIAETRQPGCCGAGRVGQNSWVPSAQTATRQRAAPAHPPLQRASWSVRPGRGRGLLHTRTGGFQVSSRASMAATPWFESWAVRFVSMCGGSGIRRVLATGGRVPRSGWGVT
jgi:hypothetical protein